MHKMSVDILSYYIAYFCNFEQLDCVFLKKTVL